MKQSDLHRDGSLKIGAVARLTGLSAHTLRKWELRYDSVVPGRTERGQRVYTQSDVERLLLIKRLVDAGIAPRDVASLSFEQLTEKAEDMDRVEGVAGVAGVASVEPIRTVLVGSELVAMFERTHRAAGMLEIVASVSSAADFDRSSVDQPIDMLVFECANVSNDTRAEVDDLTARLGASAAIVLYRFCARGDLLSLQSPALVTLRAPADVDTIERVVVDLLRPVIASRGKQSDKVSKEAVLDDVPAPRLSRELVARIAQSTPRLRCECPHHLADIILGLRAFEEYSEACESRNSEDAALHRYLWRSTAQARALFEDAIEHVARAEGMSLDE